MSSFLKFQTNKVLTIEKPLFNLCYICVVIIASAIVFGYEILWLKGYQEFDSSLAFVTTIKQRKAYVISENITSSFQENIEVFDSSGFVALPKEDGSFFIITNQIITPYQIQSKCPEDPKIKKNKCRVDTDCLPALVPVQNGNGRRTGKCVQSDRPWTLDHVCEIYAWCPTEGGISSKHNDMIEEAKDSIVFILIDISFPKFDYKSRNINKKDHNFDYLMNCFHNSKSEPFCPIFKISDLVKQAGDDFEQVIGSGAIYLIIVNWDCNLDCDKCEISYKVKRIVDRDNPFFPSYSFRLANYFLSKNKQYRNLTRTFGLEFQIMVTGKARQFNLSKTLTIIFSRLTLFGAVTKFFEYCVTPCWFYLCIIDKKAKYRYRKMKYEKFNV